MNYALHGRVMRSMIPRMGLKPTDEFRQDAVRIALTSGLTRKQVADDPLPGRVSRSDVPRGWAFRNRPASRRQRSDLVTLAQIHCPAVET
jgi:hypothetical protein